MRKTHLIAAAAGSLGILVITACGSSAAHAPPPTHSSSPAAGKSSSATSPQSIFDQAFAGGIVLVEVDQPGTTSTAPYSVGLDLLQQSGSKWYLTSERSFSVFTGIGNAPSKVALSLNVGTGAQVRNDFNYGFTEITAQRGSSAGEVNLNGQYTPLATPAYNSSYGATQTVDQPQGWSDVGGTTGPYWFNNGTQSEHVLPGQKPVLAPLSGAGQTVIGAIQYGTIVDEAFQTTILPPVTTSSGPTEVEADEPNGGYDIAPASGFVLNSDTALLTPTSPANADPSGQWMGPATANSFLETNTANVDGAEAAETQLFICTIKPNVAAAESGNPATQSNAVVDVEPLTPNGSNLTITDAVVSPNGKTVVFEANNNLYSTPINADGAQPKLIQHLNGTYLLAAWLK